MAKFTQQEQSDLKALLQRKLRGIPADHLPYLRLSDIVNQTPTALTLPNIPRDLQLPFFLAHRDTIDTCRGLAIKDAATQHIDVTRAIFFYRLDAAHQFQRYHDSHRWNIAIFLALLTFPSTVYRVSMAARRFMATYLAAVLEHHNNPAAFDMREEFVRLWKGGNYDFFTFGASQKKLLKCEMKRLHKEWEKELGRVEVELGREAYEARVARFAGVLVPAGETQRAQRRQEAVVSMEVAAADVMQGIEMENEKWENKLLAALKVPVGEVDTEKEKLKVNLDAVPVTRKSDALWAVQHCEPRDILRNLREMFPVERDVASPV
ncbi:hypothetical protein BU26DRAFT_290537 [Trematosphaeria pertusa]|uniref:Uncharacterized protein n=1 Tax=Trematosphaeria pertusa TaxID=390896 RepID=A0A6A6IHG6_9PLEO|nr:uncharacterized protein BU26DRAFT_290537 [Trematosphaeria pertusa]KAF2249826.1 hypothetical protein BU26DRAFT_290537 [Trematosphaeria pertusa]